jgi:hypothetical protein
MAADALRFIDGLRVMGLGRRIYVTDGDKTGILRRTTQLGPDKSGCRP